MDIFLAKKIVIIFAIFLCRVATAQTVLETPMGKIKLDSVAGSGDHYVLMLHERNGRGSDWDSWFSMKRFAEASKATVWTISIPSFTSYKGAPESMSLVINKLYELGAKKVSLVGSSMGAGLVSSATSDDALLAKLN